MEQLLKPVKTFTQPSNVSCENLQGLETQKFRDAQPAVTMQGTMFIIFFHVLSKDLSLLVIFKLI